MPNTLPFSYELATIAIVSVNTFNLIFLGYYYYLEAKNLHSPFDVNEAITDSEYHKYKIAILIILIMACAATPLLALHRATTLATDDSKVGVMLMSKVIFFLPIVPALFYARFRNKSSLVMLIVAVLILLLFKNPMFEKRNALGPIYLTLWTIIFASFYWSNIRSMLLLFIALVIGFPLISIFTHTKVHQSEGGLLYAIGTIDFSTFFTEYFNQLHYDAFANIMAAIHYWREENITIGRQLLGSLLFFVPRSWWPSKPWGSGNEIGDYLTDNFLMWFNNLSIPFVGEGWINFGFAGVVIFALSLGYIVHFFGKWGRSGDFTKHITAIYFSYHIIFLMRGDMMSGVSYFVGPFLVMYVLPRSINFIFPKNKY